MRFSLKTVLILVAVVAALAWYFDPGYRTVYHESDPHFGELTIWGKRDLKTQNYELKIRFQPANSKSKAILADDSNTIILDGFEGDRIRFQSVIDPDAGLWCVCDQSEQGVVIMIETVAPANGGPVRLGYWHPGMRIGWKRGYWAQKYHQFRTSLTEAELPYKGLPGELANGQ